MVQNENFVIFDSKSPTDTSSGRRSTMIGSTDARINKETTTSAKERLNSLLLNEKRCYARLKNDRI
jgi:hypothetical protein